MNTRPGWLFLFAAILLEVTATISMKAALTLPWLSVVTVAGYVLSFTCLTLALRAGVPLGVAYGIWGAAGVALTAGLSAVIFDEPFTGLMILGVVLVIAGVLCVDVGAHAAHSRAATSEAEPRRAEHGGDADPSGAEAT